MLKIWTEGSPVFVLDENDENNDGGIPASFWKKEEGESCRDGEMGVFPPGLDNVVFVEKK